MILMDTDVCIELLRGNRKVIEYREGEKEPIAVSFMSASELYYGAYKSSQPIKNSRLVDEFLLTVEIVQSTLQIARCFGELKSRLQTAGLAIEDADLFIAATCIEACNKLVTGNIRHYQRVEELRLENWLR
jgi:tRNA(fMet)-specific endonuclease VapC